MEKEEEKGRKNRTNEDKEMPRKQLTHNRNEECLQQPHYRLSMANEKGSDLENITIQTTGIQFREIEKKCKYPTTMGSLSGKL